MDIKNDRFHVMMKENLILLIRVYTECVITLIRSEVEIHHNRY